MDAWLRAASRHPGGFVGRTCTIFLPRWLNLVRRPDPETGAPDMEKVGAFLGGHPETVPAVTAAITAPIPASYAQLTYHAIHAFRFVAPDGTAGVVKLAWVQPEATASLADCVQ